MPQPHALSRLKGLGLGIALGASACTASIDGPDSLPTSAPGGGRSGASGLDPNAPLDPNTGIPIACDQSQVLAAPAPILRLTNREYRNTLADLFPGIDFDVAPLATDNKDNGFDTTGSAQSISASLIEGYHGQASRVASAVVANLAAFSTCAAMTPPPSSCGAELVSTFAARAYRRPATTEELSRLTALFSSSEASWGFTKAVEVTIRAVLQSPAFLYRVELGRPAADQPDTTPLTGPELASRLSYLLWDSMPDATLMDAAGRGSLDTTDGVVTEARRLLAHPRARAAVATFQSQWLRFEKMDNLKKSAAAFPAFAPSTAQALADSAARYVDYLFWERGTLAGFFTDTKAFVNRELAPIYGVSAPASSELSLVDVNPSQRAGLLTQAGLLAGFAHETADAPVLRGVLVLSRLLCDTPPPPPPGTPAAPEAKPGDAPMTTRQRLEVTHVKPECNGCHASIDGIGYAFSNYDAIGAWRDSDNGLPVNAAGVLTNTLDLDGTFDGTVALGAKLAQSVQVKACVTEQWYRYALGVGEEQLNTCALKSTIEHFNASGNKLPELLVALVSSEAFRRRSVITQ